LLVFAYFDSRLKSAPILFILRFSQIVVSFSLIVLTPRFAFPSMLDSTI